MGITAPKSPWVTHRTLELNFDVDGRWHVKKNSGQSQLQSYLFIWKFHIFLIEKFRICLQSWTGLGVFATSKTKVKIDQNMPSSPNRCNLDNEQNNTTSTNEIMCRNQFLKGCVSFTRYFLQWPLMQQEILEKMHKNHYQKINTR
jgi:hypothetical protein